MRAMIVKEFRQLRRDRRTLAMMILMPVLLLVVLGYAASFDVSAVPTVVAGPAAGPVSKALPRPFTLAGTYAGGAQAPMAWARDQLRDGHAAVAIVTGAATPRVLIDGSQLFAAQAALRALSALSGGSTGPAAAAAATTGTASTATARTGTASTATATTGASVQILYNPLLKTRITPARPGIMTSSPAWAWCASGRPARSSSSR